MPKLNITRHHFDRHATFIIQCISDGDPTDRFTKFEVGQILRVSQQWLELARVNKFGPPHDRIDGEVGYQRGQLIEYLRERDRIHNRTPKGFVMPVRGTPAPKPLGKARKRPLTAAE